LNSGCGSPTRDSDLTQAGEETRSVVVQNLAYGYGKRSILNDVSIEARPGQVVAIMGGSGSGKTTLLRLMGGQLKPSRGSIRIAGQSLDQLGCRGLYQLRRKMGMLFQHGALFTDLSVFDNVAFPLREQTDLPGAMIRDLVILKLNAVGLRGAHALMPAELSGGMARRVALARAIALDPQVILFDEPFTGLDPISLSVVGSLIRRLTTALEATSILVTHDVEASFKIVDYVYIISQGRVEAEGKPDDILRSPSPFVQQFVKGLEDGPVPFHYPARDLGTDLGLVP
jgi:phospholipid/cholesterol/gamma-HCH transport system ATP-binding protein